MSGFIIFLNLFGLTLSIANIKFTNVQCKELDSKFARFEKCELKMVKRGVPALNIYWKILSLPLNNVTINIDLLKKANGYRPFLYNTTSDLCGFLKNRKRYPFLKVFFDIIFKDSNVNHTCPYNHDVIIKNMVVVESLWSNILPLPSGEYLFKIKIGCYNDWKADIKVYLTKTE